MMEKKTGIKEPQKLISTKNHLSIDKIQKNYDEERLN